MNSAGSRQNKAVMRLRRHYITCSWRCVTAMPLDCRLWHGLEAEKGAQEVDKKEAIDILQKHIVTYRHQMTEKGWEQMVRMGIARNTIQEKLEYWADGEKQIAAYEMAIKALENCEGSDWTDRCYLGSPCPFQHKGD